MKPDRTVAKYLTHWATSGNEASRINGSFGHVLVVPACDELDDALALIRQMPKGVLGDVLTLLVINSRLNAPDRVHGVNQALADAVHSELGDMTPAGPVVVIDRFSYDKRFGPKQGVGLARKIGCDVALQLWSEGRIASPWIHTTDADALLPDDYFERPNNLNLRLDTHGLGSRPGALIYPFVHRPTDAQLAPATARYDAYLCSYVDGLRSAGSPYAFHTIGSTLAVEATAYAQVRGFPDRQAGEDFHLLNKVAKVGAIYNLGGQPISLQARLSDRVPFGTGPALLALQLNREAYGPYAREVFAYLAAWLGVIARGVADPTKSPTSTGICFLDDIIHGMDGWRLLKQACSGNVTQKQRHTAAHVAWDGLATLQLVRLTQNALAMASEGSKDRPHDF